VVGLPQGVPVVSKLAQRAGYRCGLVGSLHLSNTRDGVERRTDDGFSYWQYGPSPHWGSPHYHRGKGNDYALWLQENGGDLDVLLSDPRGFPEKLHHITWSGQKAVEFFAESDSAPWFACLNFFSPHPPFNPAQEFRNRYNPDVLPGPSFKTSDLEQQARLALVPYPRGAHAPDNLNIGIRNGQPPNYLDGRADAGALKAAYYAVVTQVDDQIGKILRHLEETGQRKNTLIVLHSDHGEMLGDHGLIYKGCRFYEGLTRVPLIWNWPDRIPRGTPITGLVELLDVAPTLLDLLGEPVPAHMQGNSIAPVLRGEADGDHLKSHVRCEYYDASAKINSEGMPGYGTMYRDERYKLVVYHPYDLGELYDLDTDPQEFDNLWDSPNHQALKLRLMKHSFDATVLATDWGGAPIIRRALQ
jgi:arylsulfatase A-like enzyme